jgi:hypothetical protein
VFRPLLVTAVGGAFVGVAVWSAAGMVVSTGKLASGSNRLQFASVGQIPAPKSDKQGRVGKLSRLLSGPAQPVGAMSFSAGFGTLARYRDVAAVVAASGDTARFDFVVTTAALTVEKPARKADQPAPARSQRVVAKLAAPAVERFGELPAVVAEQAPVLLAYADPSPTADSAFAAVLGDEEQVDVPEDPNLDPVDGAAVQPDEDPSAEIPTPQSRPRDYRPDKSTEQPAELKDPKAAKAARQNDEDAEAPKKKQVASLEPSDEPEKKSKGSFLRDLFGGGNKAAGIGKPADNARGPGRAAGKGVAVYDISAAKVYMPDGSVLEAHSGIGEMADNPRYINVKMRGPTPPHTYNLKLREKRFHGVEALRMLPVDGKNRNGRDGLLAHSYLLFGRRAQSHGCVAFKDYPAFLKAFKQGKISQLVVVASGGKRAKTRLASAN